MYKLGFKEAEEPEVKLPTFTGSWRKQGNSRKNICFVDYTKAFDCVDHNCGKFLKNFICLLRNLYAGQEATVRTRHETTGSKLGKA